MAPPAAAAAPSTTDEERYHVLFGPGDVREVTLEQVDDFFRLGIINQETYLWTQGMDGWQTLGDAAGLGEEVEVAPSSGSRHTEPPPVRRGPPPPPSRIPAAPQAAQAGSQRVTASRAPVVSIASAPQHPPPRRSDAAQPRPVTSRPPVQQMASMPAPAARPSGVVARPASQVQPASRVQPASQAPTGQVVAFPLPNPPLRVVPSMPAVAANQLRLASPQSLAPMVHDSVELESFGPPPGRGRRRFQTLLLTASLIAGAAVTLYRNDWPLTWAKGFQQGAAYLDFEKKWLGGAPQGTPREVDTLLGREALPPGAATPADGAAFGASLVSAAVVRTPLPASDSDTPPASEPAGAVAAAEAKPIDAASEAAEAKPAEPITAVAPTSLEELPRVGTVGKWRGRSSAGKASSSSASREEKSSRSDDSEKKSRSRRSDDEDEAPKKAAVTAAPGTQDFLDQSIRQAVEESKSKKKKKRKGKKGSSFDPLNGEI